VAVAHNIPLITTISGAAASVQGIEALLHEEIQVKSLQEYHQKLSSRVVGTQRPIDPFNPRE
jgi:carbamoyl-phosphate synthase large subunit